MSDFVATSTPPLLFGDIQQSSGQFNDQVKVYGDVKLGSTTNATVAGSVGALVVSGGVTAGSLEVSGNAYIGAGSSVLGFFSSTGMVLETTSTATGGVLSIVGSTYTTSTTVDGYTIQQVVKALRDYHLLT